jgi:multimeric flavodoxin WrbA
MNALIVHSSPRGRQSGSFRLGSRFAAGLRAEGWLTDEVMLNDLEVRHCLGCRSCWSKTPGRCVQEDDMTGILAKYRDLDLTVLATPLYFYTLPGKVKDFVDRHLPLYFNQFLKATGRPPDPSVVSADRARFFLISLCGFPSRACFDALIATMHKIHGPAYAGELLVPYASCIADDEDGKSFFDLYELFHQAGQDYGRDGKISDATQRRYEHLTTIDEARMKEIASRRESP